MQWLDKIGIKYLTYFSSQDEKWVEKYCIVIMLILVFGFTMLNGHFSLIQLFMFIGFFLLSFFLIWMPIFANAFKLGINEQLNKPELAAIRLLSWQQFELFIAEVLKRQGFRIEQRGGAEADGGIDMLAWKDGEKWVVQCKHLKYERIGVGTVRDAIGAMYLEGNASHVLVVTSGKFTLEARDCVEGKTFVNLWDGEELVKRVEETQGREGSSEAESGEACADGEAESSSLTRRIIRGIRGDPDFLPIHRCPKCEAVMVLRANSKDGSFFWGCSTYGRTHCSSILNLNREEREILNPTSLK